VVLTARRELTADLAADPAVAAGHQRDRGGFRCPGSRHSASILLSARIRMTPQPSRPAQGLIDDRAGKSFRGSRIRLAPAPQPVRNG